MFFLLLCGVYGSCRVAYFCSLFGMPGVHGDLGHCKVHTRALPLQPCMVVFCQIPSFTGRLPVL
jgi:hypothetical protein